MSTVSASVSASVSAHCKTSVGLDPSHFCSNASVLATSYTIPSRWPLPPIQLVMERMPGTCDNYRGGPACCDIVNFPERLIERQVREVLVSFLTGCTTRPGGCRAADFGGNNGWMSMIMLALGARVTSVEPASDFADAIEASGKLNCFGDRHTVFNNFACEVNDRGPRSCMRSRKPWNGYRYGYVFEKGPHCCDELKARLREAHGRTVASILLDPVALGKDAPRVPHYDFIKLDGDGPEGGWMRAILKLIRRKALTVGAITLEGNNLDADTMRAYQAPRIRCRPTPLDNKSLYKWCV